MGDITMRVPDPRPHQDAADAWDHLVSRVASLQMGTMRRVLDSRSGHPLDAVEARDEIASLQAWSTELLRTVDLMIRQEGSRQ